MNISFLEVSKQPESLFYDYLAIRGLVYEDPKGQYAIFMGESEGKFVGFHRPRAGFHSTLVFMMKDKIERDYPTDPDHNMEWSMDLIEAGDRFNFIDEAYLPGSFAEYLELLNK